MAGGRVKQVMGVLRRSPLKWRLDNLRPTLSYRLESKPGLSGEAARIVSELNRNGIAISSVDALIGDRTRFNELKDTIESMGRELADEIAAARARAGDSEIEKAFKFSYVSGRLTLREDDVFVRFALQPPIVRIANAYYGMYTHLRFVNVWHTFATSAPARDSQLWHFDRDDRYILKVFVYLNDVDEGSGPFSYAPGTHKKGRIRRRPKARPGREGGPLRTTDEEMAAVVPPEEWVRATGPAGTIVFADTRGYHCGGLARHSDRLMYISMFASSASRRIPDGVIHRVAEVNDGALSPEQEFAIRG